MEYCLVNIVLGDTALPKPIPLPGQTNEPKKSIDLSLKLNGRRDRSFSHECEIPAFQRAHASFALSPPLPPIQVKPPEPKLTAAQVRLKHAIQIDRCSRILFPLLFSILNCTYWVMFYEYL